MDSKQIIWQAVDKNIKDLKPFRGNPRRGTKDQKARLETSLDRFGIANPECINLDGTVIGGNFRLSIYKERGIKIIPCMAPSRQLTDEEALELNLRLNHNTGEWDYDILSGFNEALLKDVGFDNLLEFDGDVEATEADDEVPEVLDSITKPGDLWLLGEHRVLCGDSTKPEDVARVMDGKKADMVFTDPPYGIEKEGIQNDDLKGDDFYAFSKAYIDVLPVKSDCGIVCYHSTRTFYITLNAFVDGGWKFEKMLFFYRPDKMPVHTWNSWMMTSQAIMLFSKGKPEYAKVTPAHQDVYRVTSSDLTSKTVNHPTVKPVKNCTDLMSHYDAQLIYDPFLGSGTTLIACEKTNRICYGLEIDPHYCDVIIARWEQATGKKAALGKANE